MQLLLEKNELLDLGRLVRGVGIYCREGCCWVTVEGDSRDHILQTGKNHTVGQSGRVVVTALAQSRLQLVQSDPSPTPVQNSWFGYAACSGLIRSTSSLSD